MRSSLSVAADVPFVGRSAELDALCRMVDGACDGAGHVGVIKGEAGIGKSRLLEEVLAHADRRGLRVLRGGADELERDRPFRALVQAMDLEADACEPERVALARILTVEPALGESASLVQSPSLGFRAVEAFVSLIERLASAGPVVLALEDLHWADLSTLRAVRAISTRLADLPIALLATLRPSPRIPELDRVIEGILARGGHHVALNALDCEAVAALASRVAVATPGPRLLSLVGGAGGNPLYIIELIRALEDAGAIEVTGGLAHVSRASLPPTLRLTILRRMSFLSSEALEILRIASILGTSFALADLSAVSGRTVVQLLSALEQAISAALLGASGERLAFRHELVREAIYEDLPLPLRQGLHREAAGALAASGAPAGTVAQHLLLGGRSGDAEAVPWLRRAAREAAPHAPPVAVRLLERAIELIDPADRLRDVLVAELAPSLIQTGRAVDVEPLARQVLARLPSPTVELTLRRALGEVLWVQGRIPAAAAEFEAAVRITGVAEDERASTSAMAAHLKLFLGDDDGARRQAAQARRHGARLGNDFAVGSALQTLALAADAQGYVAEAVELGRQAVDVTRASRHPLVGYLHPELYLGMILLDADRLEEAETVLQEGRRLAEEQGSVLWLPLYHALLAWTRIFGGRLDDAVAEAEAGLVLAEEVGTRLHASVLYGLLGWVAVQRDDLAVAETWMRQVRREFMATAGQTWRSVAERDLRAAGARWPLEWGLWLWALLFEAKGEASQATAALEHAWFLSAPLRYLVSCRYLGPDLVRLALANGDRDLAVAVAEEVAEGARRAGVATAEGAALRCRGLLDADPDVLVAAVEAYRRGPRPIDLAFACEDAGVALGQKGRVPEAVGLLQEALELYERGTAVRHAARAEAALRALGVRRRRTGRPGRAPATGWDSLTETELRIAGLATEGLTNRQIGERLFISRRTVETHLSHVFAKLGLATRARLAAEVARRDG